MGISSFVSSSSDVDVEGEMVEAERPTEIISPGGLEGVRKLTKPMLGDTWIQTTCTRRTSPRMVVSDSC